MTDDTSESWGAVVFVIPIFIGSIFVIGSLFKSCTSISDDILSISSSVKEIVTESSVDPGEL